MRRWGQLFEEVVSTRNLWGAWRDFRRGKSRRRSVLAFEHRAGRELPRLARQLEARRYVPSGYRLKTICEPKRRLIAAAPVRDRVVHHAVYRVLAPRLDRRLVDTTFACRAGYGSHRAVLAFLGALRRFPWVLLLDLRHYFLSVDRGILIDGVMARRLKDRPLLELLRIVAESGAGLYRRPGVADFLGLEPGFPPEGCGLPIGNLTSQWWGNHYLADLDHFVKRELRIPHYQRYMDDLALFGASPGALVEAREALADWLWRERRLRLKKPSATPRSTSRCFTHLGFRVSRAGVSPTPQLLRRMRQRLAEVVVHHDEESIERSVASYQGILLFSSGLSLADSRR